MIHIKRDGGWLCKADPKSWQYKGNSHISFTDAHKEKSLSLGYCRKCVEQYFLILDRANYIIINGKPQPQ